jgi:large subunit ribosomal protein L29
MASKNIVRAQDLRGRTEGDLAGLITDKHAELLKLEFQHATGQLENTARMGHVRREIARAATILTQKTKKPQLRLSRSKRRARG